jgi:hypothetical protein
MNKKEWNWIVILILYFGNNSYTLIRIQSKLLKEPHIIIIIIF